MNLKKVMAMVVMGSMMAVTVAGCGKTSSNTSNTSSNGKSSDEVVELKFWHTYSDEEDKVFNEKVLEGFKKDHPNIKIKAIKMPTDGLKQQVVQGVAGNATPDLMRMDIVWVPEFSNIGALKEVASFEKFNEIKDKCFEGPMNTTKLNDKYFGLPLNTNTKVAIYNKTVLKEAGLTEPPKTFDELISVATKIKSKHPNGLIGLGGNDGWSMSPYFLSLGGKYTDDKYSKADGYINSKESIEALEKLIKLNDDGIIGKCLLGGQPGTWDGIKKDGEYLMIDDGPWFYSILKDEAKGKTVNALMPEGPGGRISVVGGEDVVMFNNTKHPKECWEFMQYLLSMEPQKTMALKCGLIPTNKEAANDTEVVADPIVKIYVDQLKTAWARIPNPKWEEINDKIAKAFEQAMRKKAEPKDVLDKLAKDMDALLQAK